MWQGCLIETVADDTFGPEEAGQEWDWEGQAKVDGG